MEKTKVQELIEAIEKECKRRGMNPPKEQQKTGTFITIKVRKKD